MKATFKVKVLQGETPPVPQFVGTRITIEVPPDTLRWGFQSATLAEGSTALTIDWGDGTVETLSGTITRPVHDYAAAGRYTVEISDDIQAFAPSSTGGDVKTVYAPMIRAYECLTAKVTTLGSFSMVGLANMTVLDLRRTSIEAIGASAFQNCTALESLDGLPQGLRKLSNMCFKSCTGITGKVYLPCVDTLSGTSASSAPFIGCTGITEIHFAEANRAAIESSQIYQIDNHLGAANATVVFDP